MTTPRTGRPRLLDLCCKAGGASAGPMFIPAMGSGWPSNKPAPGSQIQARAVQRPCAANDPPRDAQACEL